MKLHDYAFQTSYRFRFSLLRYEPSTNVAVLVWVDREGGSVLIGETQLTLEEWRGLSDGYPHGRVTTVTLVASHR